MEMESYRIEHVSFTYPEAEQSALKEISLTVKQGEFVTLCGQSGCGKTTLLRLLKPVLSPHGKQEGEIFFCGVPLGETEERQQASRIGFVLQSPEHQIVTDKVWHELAFGLESLGFSTAEIRARVSEMASFFGIEHWFYQKTNQLSGGQKQLLNLAAVMAMQPEVLILDEPTAQLDPIAAQDFLHTLGRINRELGTTVILSEHRLEEAFPLSDRVIVLEQGRILADGAPKEVCRRLRGNPMYQALPATVRICGEVEPESEPPLTVREGRLWLSRYGETHSLYPERIAEDRVSAQGEPVISVQEAWFRYAKALPDVIKGLSLTVQKGELFAIVGGNGTGKTTALRLISGLSQPYRGMVLVKGKKLQEHPNRYGELLGVLPQNPQTLFAGKTVREELEEMLRGLPCGQAEEQLLQMAELCRLTPLLSAHPYDLSGGEQQRTALAKVLLQKPEILLMDEPTKGMDAHFKRSFADILCRLKQQGTTVVMVSHDIEFCAAYADRCALFFDGAVTSQGTPRAFFAGNSFYTTSANRMARGCLERAVLAEDVILACGKKEDAR